MTLATLRAMRFPTRTALITLLPVLGHAAPPAPEVLPRAAWQAQLAEESTVALRPMGPVKHVTVHHTAVAKPRGDGTPEAELRIIQRGHRDDNRWGDIAYHYLIAADGRIFEGRSTRFAPDSGTRYLTEAQWRANPIVTPDGSHPDPNRNLAVGGAAPVPESVTGPRPGRVQGHLTVCFLGDFMEAEPSEAARRAFVALCAHLLHRHRLSVEDVWLHREVASSACPGNRLYAWLRDYPRGGRYAPGPGLVEVRRRLESQVPRGGPGDPPGIP